MRPQRSTDRLTVVVGTSRSPGQRADVAQRRGVGDARAGRRWCRRARGSRRPPGPSAPRAWERSCRQASTRSPCPAPSLTMAGRSGMGAMLATSSRASRVGRAATLVTGPGVGGVAHVADDGDDERRELALPAAGRADVERVRRRRRTPRGRVAACVVDARAPSVRYAASTPDAVDQIPDCSRESVATMPASRSVAGASSPAPEARISRAGAPLWRSIQWRTSRMDSSSIAAAWSRVERSAPARSVQWCSPVRDAAQAARTDHRVGRHDGGVPTRRPW